MSDLEPGGAPDLVPGAATAEDASTSAFQVGTLPQYVLTFLGSSTSVALNDCPSLVWTITEANGNTVPEPSGDLMILLPDGTSATVSTLYASSGSAALSMTISAVYLFAERGVYTVELQVVLNDGVTPVQTRSCITQITVQ